MRANCYLWIMLLCFSASTVFGLSIGYEGSSLPFTVTYDQTMQSSFAPVLQVVNGADAGVVILSWQLELEVHPLNEAQGELLFESAATPPASLFGQEPGPVVDLTTPSDRLLAFDSDTTDFDGEPVSQHTARNILQLTLVATPDAAGTFQLVMPAFDPANPDRGSSWFEPEGFEPVAFDNSTPSAFPGYVLLGTIDVTQPLLAGDYDSDGVVGPLDYDRWRMSFGSQVSTPGEDADGNGDLIIDAADYVIWRKHFVFANASGSIAVPEPASLVLVGVGLAVWMRWWSRAPRTIV